MNRAPLFLALLFLSLPFARGNPPDWKPQVGHRYAMVVYVRVVDALGKPLNHPGSLLAAESGGKVRGVTPCSDGPSGPLYQLKVGSHSAREILTYRFYDAGTRRVRMIKKGPSFVSESLVGTIAEPVTLTVKP